MLSGKCLATRLLLHSVVPSDCAVADPDIKTAKHRCDLCTMQCCIPSMVLIHLYWGPGQLRSCLYARGICCNP